MDKDSSFDQAPWIPTTPMKPVTPIYYPIPAEGQSNPNQTSVGNNDLTGLGPISFGDLLALADTASISFDSQTPGGKLVPGEMLQKGNDTMESFGSVKQIKTPEKPKRKKHRPKVIKPKKDPKPQKPTTEKTPKRKYVRKKVEISKEQESTPVESVAGEALNHAKKLCRRVLDFEDESFKFENRDDLLKGDNKQAGEAGAVSGEKPTDSIPLVPTTPMRKRRQSKQQDKEASDNRSNDERVDVFMTQPAKRRQGKDPNCDINPSGVQYDGLHHYQNMHWLHFENVHQTGPQLDRHETSIFDSNWCSFTSQPSSSRFPDMEGEATFQRSQYFGSEVKIGTPIKKRTTGRARFRTLSSFNMEVSELSQARGYSRPQNNNFLAESLATSSRKKRTTKSVKSQTVLRQQLASFAAGLPPDELWKQFHTIEAIIEKFRLLDINKELSETDLVPYKIKSQPNKMIIFNGGGAIVPFTPRIRPPRPPRAKVDLDSATERIWKLLLEDINSEGVDGSDEQEKKFWEDERNVLRGRADSFIARMHLVQGDRRFTPWKGSVVDSVVGVFLTQNVADHLSSSAYMFVAAQFPAPYVPSSSFEVGSTSTMPPSIRITYLDSEESMSNPSHNNTQSDEKKDYVNSDETSTDNDKTTDLKAAVDSDRQGSSTEVVETDQTYPSQDSELTYQNSLVSERAGSSSETNSKGEHFTSFVKLLQSLESAQVPGKGSDVITVNAFSVEESNQKNQTGNLRQEVGVSGKPSPDDSSSEAKDFKSLKRQTRSSDDSNGSGSVFGDVLSFQKPEMPETCSSFPSVPDLNESTSFLDVREGTAKPSGPDSSQHLGSSSAKLNPMDQATLKAKGKKVLKDKNEGFDWDSLRRDAQGKEGIREKTARTMDSVDWEALRSANPAEVARTIECRGMNHKLTARIQAFLNRIIEDHGSIDLEWLRDVPPDKAKEYLMSFDGLGLKSVECVRLLTLHHLAFPVDVNVGRIAVRLGWVPLQPLPEDLQIHLLDMYPVLESVQKYLWPRLCKLDQKTLYELHYQMITFGKVFCTKKNPNCNACPMKGECRHFASAFASAKLALPSTEKVTGTPDRNHATLHLPEPFRRNQESEIVNHSEPANRVTSSEPIIEMPASPEPESEIADIEDLFADGEEEIPTIRLDIESFTNNLKKIMEHNNELDGENISTALVALTAEAASLPMPKLKQVNRLRTEHRVYELPDSHPLLAEMEKREPDDPCPYLLAIWAPGETANSSEPSVSKCIPNEKGKLCNEETCFSCNNIKEEKSQTVRGTILIPCRTAMRGSFPLNGTYFQVNEVFADHYSSKNPIDVPRQWLWNLPRRTVYFGSGVSSIFKGLSADIIQHCFWRGYVCVRGFDRKTRKPMRLVDRLHYSPSTPKSEANRNAQR